MEVVEVVEEGEGCWGEGGGKGKEGERLIPVPGPVLTVNTRTYWLMSFAPNAQHCHPYSSSNNSKSNKNNNNNKNIVSLVS